MNTAVSLQQNGMAPIKPVNSVTPTLHQSDHLLLNCSYFIIRM